MSSSDMNEKKSVVPFSTLFLVVVFLAKPVADAMYSIGIVKYLYFSVFIGAFFVAIIGIVINRRKYDLNFQKFIVFYSLALALYFMFLLVLAVSYGGGMEEVIKKVTPFIAICALGLVGGISSRRLVAGTSVLVIVANFAVLPFDFSWTSWGGINTFRGFYYFKLDLAFCVTMALLAYFVSTDRRLSVHFALLALMAVVMVVLSNSRMNYLLVFCVLVYSAYEAGISLKNLAKYCAFGVIIFSVALILYDPSKFLSPFDVSNIEKFSQGRNRIWEAVWTVGILGASLKQIVFGQGLMADWLISYRYGGLDQVHDAHNEFLHLLVNQGLFGIAFYLSLWIVPILYVVFRKGDRSSRRLLIFVCTLFVVQSVTSVVSSYYLKMWWLVLFLYLACERASIEPER